MKKSHFLGDWWFLCDLLCHFWWIFGWDWGTPAILRQNPNIYGQFQGKLGFGQFWKKVGIGSDPPPSLGQIPNFYQKFVLKASLRVIEQHKGGHFTKDGARGGWWGNCFIRKSFILALLRKAGQPRNDIVVCCSWFGRRCRCKRFMWWVDNFP